MKKKTIYLLLALSFALAGGLSFWAGRAVLRSGGTTEITVYRLPGGARAEEFRPDCVLGESAGAVLILARPGDGSRLVASELARRGVTAYLASQRNAAEAWEFLAGQPYVRRSAMGLLARGRGTETALALAESLAASGKQPGATVLCGAASLSDKASENVRDLLVLTDEKNVPDETEGYFAEGTARRISSCGTSWYKRGVKTALFDWLGSALGHNIELADDDLRCGVSTAWTAAAIGLWLFAAAYIVSCIKKEGNLFDR